MYAAQYRPLPVLMTTRDEDGVAANNTGDVTVQVLDEYGTVVASGTAPNAAGNGTGEHTYTPPTSVTNALGTYTVRFTYVLSGTTYRVEVPYVVYGAHLFEISELRETAPELASAGDYPAREIRRARDAATEYLERAAGVAFSARSRTFTVDGTGTSTILLPVGQVNAVNSVYVDDVQITDLDGLVVYPDGRLSWDDNGYWAAGRSNVTVDVDYGYEAVPAPVRRAAMILAVEYLVPSALPPRAMSQSTDLGEFRISIANPDAGRWTGIPDVDAVIQQFGLHRPVVA